LQRKLVSALILGLIALALVVPIHEAVAEQPRGPQVGDVLKLESVRGIAHDPSANRTMKATLVLTLTVTSVNKAHVRFVVTGGQISFGDNVYSVKSGEGRAVARKFGWVTLHGNTSLSSGKVFVFRLEGMLHHERRGITLAGLVGGIGDGTARSPLSFVAKLSRT